MALWLRRFELDRPWMEAIREGQYLVLDVEQWVNKSSGRGAFRLVLFARHLDEKLVRDWPFLILPGVPYEEVIPGLFPWAIVEVDEHTYDDADEDRWREEEGIWDSEEGRYIVMEPFEEWQARQPTGLRPYQDDGEVAKWRLHLTLGPLGEAFLTIRDFVQDTLDHAD